ncbi:MAG TPA: helix-turn-helix domain-containing protein [Galbitalea sp.]|jgi:addiction module HigA family antidote
MIDKSFEPDWIVPPGEVLAEALAERGMTQAELARRMARPLKTISEIATGKAALTAETAIQLERTLGISASLWSGLEARYREGLARRKAEAELRSYGPWTKLFPIKQLRSFGALPAEPEAEGDVGALLTFFGVASPEGWERRWDSDATRFRMGTSKQTRHAVTAWLRLGEMATEHWTTGPFDRRRLRREMPHIALLSNEALFVAALDELRDRLSAAGVLFVVVPALEGAPVSGAARWLRREVPLVQLSMRYLADDQFWFSVLHECAHLLSPSRVDVVEDAIDGEEDSNDEQVANRVARDILLPGAEFTAFVAARDFSRPAVMAFAASLKVSPGVVVGRLHRDNLVPWRSLNDLRRFYPKQAWRLAKTPVDQ